MSVPRCPSNLLWGKVLKPSPGLVAVLGRTLPARADWTIPPLQPSLFLCQTATKPTQPIPRLWGQTGESCSSKETTRILNESQGSPMGNHTGGTKRGGTRTGRRPQGCARSPFAHLLLIPFLQELQVAPLLAVPAQGTVLVVGQPRGGGNAAALRVHPGVDVVGDITPWDAPHRVHRQVQLLAALQHLQGKPNTRG